MSVAPLIQLMSRGKQNDILSGDSPQITFWRYRHMRYTDFALEHVNVTNGQGEQAVALGPMKFDLPRSGDLVNDCFAVFRLPGLANTIAQDGTARQVLGRHVCETVNHTAAALTRINFKGGNKLEIKGAATTIKLDSGSTYIFQDAAGNNDLYVFTMGTDAQAIAADRAISALTLNGVSTTANTADLEGTTFKVDTAASAALDMDAYWDVDARCIRTGSTTTLASNFGSSRTTAVAITSKNIELIESAEERQRYHQAATQAFTAPGPQPYWCNGVGQAILDKVQLKVGSQYVDHLYSDYLFMWDELSDKPGRSVNTEGYGRMCMKGTAAQRKCWSQTASTVYVPIPMFFMRTSGNALPLIALQFHGVCIELNCLDPVSFIINSSDSADRDGISGLFTSNNGMSGDATNAATANIATVTGLSGQKFQTIVRSAVAASGGVSDPADASTGSYKLCASANNAEFAPSSANKVTRAHCHVSLNVGYVYLNVAERNKFADASFEILIDQVQENIQTEINGKSFAGQSLTLNHMVQELIWACKRTGEKAIRYEPFDYRGERDYVNHVARDPIKSVQLRLNNSTRFNMNNGSDVDAQYFRTVEPYLHHTRVPDNHIYAYSFALNPESEQPSGAINMSRIDSAKLTLQMSPMMPFASGGARKIKDSLAREQHTDATVSKAGADHTGLNYGQVELKLFARNWNVFRVTLGLGGVKWAS